MYQVFFTKSAHKEYRSLAKPIRQRIDAAIAVLRVDPTSEILKVRKMKGHDALYRLRVGDHRIVYTPEHKQVLIRIIRVGHRRDVYRAF